MKKYSFLLFSIVSVGILFLLAPQVRQPVNSQAVPTPTIFGVPPQEVLQAVEPSFGALGPCPSCETPSIPVVSGFTSPYKGVSPSSGANPTTVMPCTAEGAAIATYDKGSKHKKKQSGKKGAIGKGTESFLKILLELLNLLLQLLGGGPINTPQPTTPDPGDAKPDPCPPAAKPSSSVDPSKTEPSKAAPSSGVEPSGAAPSAGVPQPSGGADATACVSPGGELEDQDTSDSQSPWKRTGGAKVVITFETKGVPAEWVTEMQKGVEVWNKSACLDTKLVPACQPNTNCVPVEVGDGGGASGNFNAEESGGFTVGGNIQLKSSLTGKIRTNVTIHEMGHAVGLRHRKTENILMHADDNEVIEADETDYKNLLRLYGGQK